MTCKYCQTEMFLEGYDYCCENCGATCQVQPVVTHWTDPVVDTYRRVASTDGKDPQMEKLRKASINVGVVDVHCAVSDCNDLRKLFDGQFGDEYELISQQIDTFKARWPQIYGIRV